MSVTLHTDVGDIKIELFCEQCPKTCENFLALCASGYYNGNLFHRNIKIKNKGVCGTVASKGVERTKFYNPHSYWVSEFIVGPPWRVGPGLPWMDWGEGFMIQTGDPTGTGKGGQSIWGKKFEDEVRDDLKHSTRGTVSMANSGPNSNGSQFFISYCSQPHLDLKYTVFAKVIDGLDVVDELEKLPVNPKNFRPTSETRINSVTIHANPIAG